VGVHPEIGGRGKRSPHRPRNRNGRPKSRKEHATKAKGRKDAGLNRCGTGIRRRTAGSAGPEPESRCGSSAP